MNKKSQYSISDLRVAVAKSKSIAAVLRELNLRPVGGNYRTIHRLVSENHIDISHFTGQAWNIGLKFKPSKSLTDNQVFVRNSGCSCS